MADQLTSRQREILDFISASIAERGFPPTLREIGEHFAIRSTNGVNDHLKALEKKGHLRREDLKSRAMRPVYPDGPGGGTEIIPLRRAPQGTQSLEIIPASDDDMAEIPILGRVAAGQPIVAEENWSGSLELSGMFGQTENLFALQVRGDSMIDAGILQGDYVIVQKQESASAGEIVVGLLDEEATVKYYQPRKDRVELVPANEKYQPIVVTEDADFRILGIVRGVVRSLGRS